MQQINFTYTNMTTEQTSLQETVLCNDVINPAYDVRCNKP